MVKILQCQFLRNYGHLSVFTKKRFYNPGLTVGYNVCKCAFKKERKTFNLRHKLSRLLLMLQPSFQKINLGAKSRIEICIQ